MSVCSVPTGPARRRRCGCSRPYLSPTSGRACARRARRARRAARGTAKVGYLPENVPLYPEMRVIEYLLPGPLERRFPVGPAACVGEVISRCQLGEVEHRIIGQLSRGFRQRVGRREAMVHDPPDLDPYEPTAGLDPLQIREVRSLIGSWASGTRFYCPRTFSRKWKQSVAV